MEKNFFAAAETYAPEILQEALKKTLLQAAAEKGGISGKKIMIKPNLLEYRKTDDPASVNPLLLSELCRLLKAEGAAEIAIIENPAVRTAPAIIESMGIAEKLAELGVLVSSCNAFEKVSIPGNCTFNKVEISTEFRNFDLIIDFAKVKTHGMMTLTLGVKNLFGLIRGSERLSWHLTAGRDYQLFADLLLDLYLLVKPHLTLLDGIVGMEGNGPGSGDAVKLGFVACGTDAVALDDAVSRILKCPEIPLVVRAKKRELLPEYQNCGEIPQEREIRLPEPPRPTLAWGVYFPVRLREYLRKKMISKPVVRKKECISCGLCAAKCPPGALSMVKRKPFFDYDKCIRCYCCQEYCPQGAIFCADTFLMRCAATLEKIIRKNRH